MDGRFTCKITDYGLPRLYDAQNMYDEVQENESSEDLLWGRGRQMWAHLLLAKMNIEPARLDKEAYST